IGGLSGWLTSLAPLVIVNLLALAGVMDPSFTPIAGGVALALGIVLGGLLAGLCGGRRGAGWGGTVAGALAATLFGATLIGLGVLLWARHQLPYLLALHPIRAMGAVGFVGCLVMGVAAVTGALSARRRERRAVAQMAAARRSRGTSQQPPLRQRERNGSVRDADWPSQPTRQTPHTNPRDPRHTAESQARERAPHW
ncbi:MAG TPA: hypothetical protein VID72_07115, partial [Ktedonobacterales bacterium]